jgi:hypothetical protein
LIASTGRNDAIAECEDVGVCGKMEETAPDFSSKLQRVKDKIMIGSEINFSNVPEKRNERTSLETGIDLLPGPS